MTNNSLSTLAQSQENIWNLSRLSIGMCENDVLRIMDKPYKTQRIECEDKKYEVWFYVTKPSGLGQGRLVKQNVTPLTFQDGVLQGWGFELYDKLLHSNTDAEPSHKSSKPQEDKRIEKVIQELQKKPTGSKKTSQNQSVSDSSKTKKTTQEDSESEKDERKPENSPVDPQDEKMIDDQNDENFNFW